MLSTSSMGYQLLEKIGLMMNRNILIIHQGALGDFVIKFPAILRLKKKFDSLDVICESQLGKLATQLGIADQWFPLEAAYFSSLFAKQVDQRIKDLLRLYPRIVLFSFSQELEKSITAITTAPCLRIPPKPPPKDRIHITEFTLQRLVDSGLLDDTLPDDDGPILIDGLQDLTRNPGPSEKIFIHPGAGSVRKRWPLAHFFNIEERLRARGLTPEFILGPAERDLTSALGNSQCKRHILSDLPALAALLKSGGGYIGNDSGASHLAAFLGLPTAVIFGPADPMRWKPNGRAVAVVRPALECEPCFETEPANCADQNCLHQITPESVIDAFLRVYEQAAGDRSRQTKVESNCGTDKKNRCLKKNLCRL